MFELPVLMLTAKNGVTDMEVGFSSGANDYLTKPFEKIELISRINTLLNMKKAVSVSMESIEKYSEEKQHRELAEKMREINSELTSEIKKEIIIEKLFKLMYELVKYDKAEIFIKINGRYDVMSYEKESETLSNVVKYADEKEKNILTEVIRINKPLIKEILNDNGNEATYILGIPVIYQNEYTGIILFESKKKDFFNSYDVELIFTMAGQAAIAIQNAKLFEEVEKWTKELEKSNKELEDSLEELKLTQEQLIMSEKMAGLGSLVAGVAHEINTPIGIAITSASLLNEESMTLNKNYMENNMSKEEFELYLGTTLDTTDLMLTNLKRAGELIRNFKQVSVDQTSDVLREIDIGKYVDEVISSLTPQIKRTKHKIIADIPEKIKIESYPGAISQILTNFVMNSIVHGFENIEEGEIKIVGEVIGDTFIMKYSDNGCGIKSENISKIFEPFFTTKRNKGGTGLGLHIVYNLVIQRLKGKIECSSKEGEGTSFTIYIPL